MLENLIISVNVVLPLFLMMALGYVIRVTKLADKSNFDVMNRLVFRIFLPVLIFSNIYNAGTGNLFDIKLILFAVVSVIVIFSIAAAIIPLIEKDKKKVGVMIQGIFRSNFVLFGLPIAVSLFGADAAAKTSILISIVIPVFNVLAVVALTVFKGDKPDIKSILMKIVTNPLIIGSAVSIVFMLSGLRLPDVIETVVDDIGGLATPLAFIVLGGSFDFSAVKGNMKQLLICLISRLVAVPAVFIPIAVMMGFSDIQLVALMGIFTAPTAVSSFTMAQQMDCDAELAGQIVVFGCAAAIFTIFLCVFLLKQLGLL